jgi:predicted dehydrogenase
MSVRPIRLGVIGAGAWGVNHIRAISGERSCELVAVADPDDAALAKVHDLAPTARTTRDPDRLLAADDIDAVVIASPAPTHPRLACAAFAAGKHALVEKPLAMTAADASAVEAASIAANKIGMVGHLMLYHPAVVRLRELLVSGALGSLYYLHSTRVNLGRLRRDENALWSFGPHDLSMIQFLVGRAPTSVAARGQSVLQPGVEDVVFLTLRYATGEIAHVHLSWLNPRKERRLTLVCSKKMAELDDVAPDKLRIYDKGYDRPPEFADYAEYLSLRDGDVHIPQIAMQEPLLLQLRHFLDCIEHRKTPTTNLHDAVALTAILEAAQRSLKQDGTPIDLGNLAALTALDAVDAPSASSR